MTDLIHIERRLFGNERIGDDADNSSKTSALDLSSEQVDDEEDQAISNVTKAVMEAYAARLQHLKIAQNAGAPAAGQIVEVRHDGFGPLSADAPVLALLHEFTPRNTWKAWLVSADSEYATSEDLVVQEMNGLVPDPSVRIVQCWNEVEITPKMVGKLRQCLDANQLAGARSVAASPDGGDGQIRYSAREVNGVPVVTGSSRGAEDDPRTEYRNLYRTAGYYVTACAHQQMGYVSKAERLLVGIAERFKQLASELSQDWAPHPLMRDPSPEAIDYDLGGALNACFFKQNNEQVSLRLSSSSHRALPAWFEIDGRRVFDSGFDSKELFALESGHEYGFAYGDKKSIATDHKFSFSI